MNSRGSMQESRRALAPAPHLRLVQLDTGPRPFERDRIAWERVWWWSVAGAACLLTWAGLFSLLRAARVL